MLRVLAGTRSDSRCLVEWSGSLREVVVSGDHFFLRDWHGIQEGLHWRFAKAPVSLMGTPLIVSASTRPCSTSSTVSRSAKQSIDVEVRAADPMLAVRGLPDDLLFREPAWLHVHPPHR